jgi:hypothetical protein
MNPDTSQIEEHESMLDTIACELLQHATPVTAEHYYVFLKSLHADLREKFGDVFENFKKN